ncbi:MAG: UMP kinase [Candidatus Thermoplasmatota archaeon]|nr:UMP kinase [Candidatus Thermoplasmatota archaeon]
MKVVVAFGGSLISAEEPESIKKVGKVLDKCTRDIGIYIIVGGGKTSRKYIGAARFLGADEKFLDEMGIAVTRLNAMLIKASLKDETPVPKTVEEAAGMRTPVIMGGTIPGHSTDTVGAMLAREIKADRFVIATDVDGIYDKDPKKNPTAKKYDSISIKELREMVPNKWDMAGKNSVVDGIACKIIDEEKMPTYVVNGRNLELLENAIYGREFKGTRIEV